MSAVNPNSRGFINHGIMALVNDATPLVGEDNYNKNILERVGDVLSWHAVQLPLRIFDYIQDPRFITVVTTAFVMIGVQFGFYPIITTTFVKNMGVFLANYVPYGAVKFSAYLIVEVGVLGLGLRALGRFTNQALMQQWYNLVPQRVEVLPVGGQVLPWRAGTPQNNLNAEGAEQVTAETPATIDR